MADINYHKNAIEYAIQQAYEDGYQFYMQEGDIPDYEASLYKAEWVDGKFGVTEEETIETGWYWPNPNFRPTM